MSHVVVLATGGTIASRTSTLGGSVAADSAHTLVHNAISTTTEITIEAIDVTRVNSFNLSPADQRHIVAVAIQHLERPEVAGIVVTHGTDTLEETAFLADLAIDDARPVVFTGAQRAADLPATDGPSNLRDAVTVAAHPAAKGRGVLVTFAGEIFAARGLRKTHTLALQPFVPVIGGPLGQVFHDSVRFESTPESWARIGPPSPSFGDIRVDAVLTYPGASAHLFHSAVDSGAQGIVIVGTGAGNGNTSFLPCIAKATAAGVVVALSTRVPQGPVTPIYGSGGGADAVSAGAISMGSLPFPQVRVLLALLLDRYDQGKARVLLDTFDSRP